MYGPRQHITLIPSSDIGFRYGNAYKRSGIVSIMIWAKWIPKDTKEKVICILPEGWRPPMVLIFPVVAVPSFSTDSYFLQASIDSGTGEIMITNFSGYDPDETYICATFVVA